ncbi:MAG: hypothetical protein M1838_003685 [Thelocarpon superellum]|nr:MAG: hypothetical protein M1838_003685 [Thelocarpon superellum]
MPSAKDSSSKAGIITSDGGDRRIPASTRSDGSTRKEIKIRPGYKPPEDVEVYKNRAADAWKSRGSGGVPGAASVDASGAGTLEGTASNKNAKRREARKKAKSSESKRDEGGGADDDARPAAPSSCPDGAALPGPVDVEAELEKQAKKLQKKLRQARELKQKKESGESLLPEQFEKVIKIHELIRQLDQLGFDTEGERKQTSTPPTVS